MTHEALLYDPLADGWVRCHLCAHRCLIGDRRQGICRVRENRGGQLATLVYGCAIARNVDPVEKKPLFHFHPGTLAYSVGTPGCNMRCAFCQNWSIAQLPREADLRSVELDSTVAPAAIVAAALRTGSRSIAYTYTEPTIFFEYAYDTARQAQAQGLANIFVSNGYQTPETLELIRPYLDAANIDLKSFSDRFYRKVVGARLQPVLDTLKLLKRMGVWVEVTTLVIPAHNDSAAELRTIAHFIRDELGAETPWHVSGFYPTYKLTQARPTPRRTLQQAREIGLAEGLHYVYESNVPGSAGEHTDCRHCGTRLIERQGFHVHANWVRDGHCPECDTPIAGVGLSVDD